MNNEASLVMDETMDLLIDELFDMEVVDASQYFGLSVDRETNERIAYNKINANKPSYKGYVPKIIGWGDKLSMSMCLLVKITTPIKLNLINTNSQALISQEMVSEKEVHYVQFEAIHRTYECNFNCIS